MTIESLNDRVNFLTCMSEGSLDAVVTRDDEDITVSIDDRRVVSLVNKLLRKNGFDTFVSKEGAIEITPRHKPDRVEKRLRDLLSKSGYKVK